MDTALNELMAAYKAHAEAEAIEEAARKAEAQRVEEAQWRELEQRARTQFEEMTGALFNEIITGEIKHGVNWRTWELEFKTLQEGVSFMAVFEIFDDKGNEAFRLVHRRSYDDRVIVKLPCEQWQIGKFIVEARNYAEWARTQEALRRESEVERAILKISDARERDFYETAENIFEDFMRICTDGDARARVTAAMEAARAEAARKAEEEQAQALRQAELQKGAFFPFVVWELTYGVMKLNGEDEEGERFSFDRCFALDPEADEEGWWKVVRKGKISLMRFPGLLSIEEMLVDDVESTLAGLLCERVAVDGCSVLRPPNGCAIAMSDDEVGGGERVD